MVLLVQLKGNKANELFLSVIYVLVRFHSTKSLQLKDQAYFGSLWELQARTPSGENVPCLAKFYKETKTTIVYYVSPLMEVYY